MHSEIQGLIFKSQKKYYKLIQDSNLPGSAKKILCKSMADAFHMYQIWMFVYLFCKFGLLFMIISGSVI